MIQRGCGAKLLPEARGCAACSPSRPAVNASHIRPNARLVAAPRRNGANRYWTLAMRLISQESLLVLIPETDQEARDLEAWRVAQPQRVFAAAASGASALELRDIRPRPD